MKKLVFLILGWISFAFGILGFFLPIMPSVPFMILAGYFFSKGSNSIHAWLLRQPHVGSAIKNWETHRVLRKDVKWAITFSFIFMLIYPFIFLTIRTELQVLMVIAVVSGIAFTWRFPSKVPEEN